MYNLSPVKGLTLQSKLLLARYAGLILTASVCFGLQAQARELVLIQGQVQQRIAQLCTAQQNGKTMANLQRHPQEADKSLSAQVSTRVVH